MHKTILGYELGIILFPISILTILGGGYIIIMALGGLMYHFVQAIMYLILTILLFCSLSALWVFALAIADGKKLPENKLKTIFLFCNIGAAVSILSIVAIFIENFGPDSIRKKTEMILMYSIGAPALLPYVHARYIHHQSRTKSNDSVDS